MKGSIKEIILSIDILKILWYDLYQDEEGYCCYQLTYTET